MNWAIAFEQVDQVIAFTIIFTRGRVALVDFFFAVVAFEAGVAAVAVVF